MKRSVCPVGVQTMFLSFPYLERLRGTFGQKLRCYLGKLKKLKLQKLGKCIGKSSEHTGSLSRSAIWQEIFREVRTRTGSLPSISAYSGS